MRVLKLKADGTIFFEAVVGNESIFRVKNEQHVGASYLLSKVKEVYGREEYKGPIDGEVVVINLMEVSKYSYHEALDTLSNCSNCTIFIDNHDWLRDKDLIQGIEIAIELGMKRNNKYFVISNKGFHSYELLRESKNYSLTSSPCKGKKVWGLEPI